MSESRSAGFVFAVILGLFILIAGFSGLFKTAWNIGGFISKVPVWVWISLGGFWLLSQMRR